MNATVGFVTPEEFISSLSTTMRRESVERSLASATRDIKKFSFTLVG